MIASRGLPVLLALLPMIGCIEPECFRQVQEPRAGSPLNERLCLVYSDHYRVSFAGLEKLHSFDVNKYAKIYMRLVADGLVRPKDIYVPQRISRADLLRVHSAAYLERLKSPAALAEYLEFGPAALLPAWLADFTLVRPFGYATGGTLLAARLALQHGIAINLGGGYHHAEPERGGGFCLFADMPIAIRTLQAEGRIRNVLIVDLDVHQGNGTDLCLAGDDRVFIFDMHEDDIYPEPKARSTLDVPLPRGMDDATYLGLLARHLPDVFERSRPEIVFYQAGVDALADDPLAHLALTPDGILARDEMVFAEATRQNVPVVMVLGGGYSKRAWHVQYRSIRQIIERYGLPVDVQVVPRDLSVIEWLYIQ